MKVEDVIHVATCTVFGTVVVGLVFSMLIAIIGYIFVLFLLFAGGISFYMLRKGTLSDSITRLYEKAKCSVKTTVDKIIDR